MNGRQVTTKITSRGGRRGTAAGLIALMCLLAAPGAADAQSLFERPMADTPASQPAAASPAQPESGGNPGSGGGGGTTQNPGQQAHPAPAAAPGPTAPPATSTDVRGQDDPDAAARRAAMVLDGYSLMVVVPPKPRTFQKHDLIEIIINEVSSQKFEQNLKTDKKLDVGASLKKFPSLRNLLELQLRNGDSQSTADLDVGSNNKFKGDGSLERKDNFTARIAAEIIDVKPNGNLVLEARKAIESNGEASTMVLSGVCRGQDITKSNTIQSSQVANLTLKVEGDGDVKDAGSKGILTRVLDTLFNF